MLPLMQKISMHEWSQILLFRRQSVLSNFCPKRPCKSQMRPEKIVSFQKAKPGLCFHEILELKMLMLAPPQTLHYQRFAHSTACPLPTQKYFAESCPAILIFQYITFVFRLKPSDFYKYKVSQPLFTHPNHGNQLGSRRPPTLAGSLAGESGIKEWRWIDWVVKEAFRP